MKSMNIEKLRERGMKTGDLYFLSHTDDGFKGWYLVINNDFAVSLNTKYKGAFSSSPFHLDHESDLTEKVVFKEDINRYHPPSIAHFFKTFDESVVKDIITEIAYKPLTKYVHAVHFGSTKLYTWRVPERLNRVNFRANDIVEVETMYGKQYVQITEVYTDEYDGKYKEIINLIKADEIPF